jgi:hypothetical protein
MTTTARTRHESEDLAIKSAFAEALNNRGMPSRTWIASRSYDKALAIKAYYAEALYGRMAAATSCGT